ncbi:hypothetical protein ACS86_17315 [Vibrio alginolyticus]|nr:hypothetical protein ACS86_17315 [Vibrio alginolyticus]
MAGIIENNTLYRFRSMNSLLGEKYQELERQSIFFAPPETLNDPVEGFRDIYFNGDSVLWRNLFKHYLVCLTNITLTYFVFGEDECIERHIQTLATEESIPEGLKDVWETIVESFFINERVESLINNIVKYRTDVHQTELSYYLSLLHPFAAKCIFEQFCNKGILKSNPYESVNVEQTQPLGDKFFEALNGMIEEHGERGIDVLLHQHQSHAQQMALIIDYNAGEQESNKRLLLSSFPFAYTQKLEQLMYPNWFTACFMSKAKNSSVWGNYGHNHSGACLIFNTEVNDNGDHYLPLTNTIVGHGMKGPIKGSSSLSFYEIRYIHKQEPLNFFESLGRLPMPTVYNQWLIDKDGTKSQYVLSFNDEWRKKYWDNFYVSITQKSQDWKYENEHRLILNNMFESYDKSGTILNYDFKSLKGIIFGIKTSDEHKLKAIRIIEEKVRQNDHYDFKFYQAYYCRHTGEIKHTELSMLKFKKLAEKSTK